MKFRWRWHLLLLPLAALAATAPLLTHGVSCGHDFDFHIDNWIEVARQWKQGIVWPHWDVSANFGAGEPRFVFYPPLSWMLGAFLGILFGWNIAPAAYVFISLVATAVSMYLLAREYAERRAAVIAAALYATNPYMMFVVYERAAYAELLSAAWMPLVVLYALRPKIDVRTLALAIALCWLTNGPAGVMATYAVALLLLLRLVAERDWKNLLRGFVAVLLGIALSAFYLWPAALERRWVQIENALTDDSGPYASFLFGRTGSAGHVGVLHTASWLAVILFVTAAVAYSVVRSRRSGRLLAIPAILLGVLLLLMLPVSAFVWRHAPQLVFLQFPWRLLVIVAVLTGLGISLALRRAGRYAWLALALGALSVATAYPHFRQYCDEEDVVPAQVAAIDSGRGVVGSDEYSARDSDGSNLGSGMPYAWLAKDANAPASKGEDTARISVREWSTEERRMVVRADRTGYLIVRMMDFPAWHLRIDGHEPPAQMRTTQRDDGLLAVPVEEGVESLDLVYREPEDMLRGRLISLSAALLLLAMSVWRMRDRSLADSQRAPVSPPL